MDYLQYGYDLLADNQSLNVMSADVNGEHLWVKKGCASKRTFWHFLQGGFAKILNQPMFSVTAIDGGASATEQEAARLQAFAAKGVSVPVVHAADTKIMVMSHLGAPLAKILDQEKDAGKREALLLQAATALSDLHAKGLVHGKPYLRDMILSEGGPIGFIDLEEDPAAVMTLAQAQARDVWLFLSSAAKYARSRESKYNYDETLIERIFMAYKEGADQETLSALTGFVSFLKPLAGILKWPFFWRNIGSDARRAVIAHNAMLT